MRLPISPTPSNTPSNTPEVTPTPSNCPGTTTCVQFTVTSGTTAEEACASTETFLIYVEPFDGSACSGDLTTWACIPQDTQPIFLDCEFTIPISIGFYASEYQPGVIGTYEFDTAFFNFSNCASVTPTPTSTPSVTPTNTPTNTITPSVTATNTSTPTPTPTTPISDCECWRFQNELGTSQDITYTPCGGTEETISMTPGQILYKCLVVGAPITSASITYVPCTDPVGCSIDSDCTSCSF